MTLAAGRRGMLGAEANEREPRQLAALGRAPEWLDSPPLSATSLLEKVVLVQFGTYTCINQLRTLPYLRAWDQKYRQGLASIDAVLGVSRWWTPRTTAIVLAAGIVGGFTTLGMRRRVPAAAPA